MMKYNKSFKNFYTPKKYRKIRIQQNDTLVGEYKAQWKDWGIHGELSLSYSKVVFIFRY